MTVYLVWAQDTLVPQAICSTLEKAQDYCIEHTAYGRGKELTLQEIGTGKWWKMSALFVGTWNITAYDVIE